MTVDTSLVFEGKQLEAINACCDITNRVVAVTGAAGSGKTTILRTVYNKLREHGYVVELCSPTGKAAKRIYEATGIEAKTIHRLLKYSHPGDPDPKTGKPMGFSAPSYTRNNPIRNDADELVDIVLADEYAMVNNDVHRNLFDALPNGACIRVFGDNNQLAPIEEDKRLEGQPSPFLNLLQNDKHKAVTLDVIYRQGQDSGILLNLQSLLKSRIPTRNDQWEQKITDQPVKVLEEYVMECLERDIDFSTPQHQIIVPQNTSWVGTMKLNSKMQSMFHERHEQRIMIPRKPWVVGHDGVKGSDIPIYLGDKVIYTENNYDLGVFNGEIGVVIEIQEETGEIVIDFGDREQAIPPMLMVQNRYGKIVSIDPRKGIDLAYTITTHKSQGSEFSHGVYILNKSNMYMINRRNFYTAASRFRDHLLILADQRGLSQAVYKRA